MRHRSRCSASRRTTARVRPPGAALPPSIQLMPECCSGRSGAAPGSGRSPISTTLTPGQSERHWVPPGCTAASSTTPAGTGSLSPSGWQPMVTPPARSLRPPGASPPPLFAGSLTPRADPLNPRPHQPGPTGRRTRARMPCDGGTRHGLRPNAKVLRSGTSRGLRASPFRRQPPGFDGNGPSYPAWMPLASR